MITISAEADEQSLFLVAFIRFVHLLLGAACHELVLCNNAAHSAALRNLLTPLLTRETHVLLYRW